MEHKYLSGNIRERLQDLMKERKITQSELAAKIEIDVSTLSRFISNATGKLSDENIKRSQRNLRYLPTSCSALPIFPTV